jgi:hypothetical protein
MKTTKKRAKAALKDLEEAWDVVFEGRKLRRSSTAWERQRKKVSEKMKNLELFVKEAVLPIRTAKSRGRPKLLGLMQRTMVFLFVIPVGKSNTICMWYYGWRTRISYGMDNWT